jgi:hypothetical protein
MLMLGCSGKWLEKELTLPRFLIINDIRLSLRSLSSFFLSFSTLALIFSASFSALILSFPLSLASECKLRRDDDLSKEGKPKLKTEDFFDAEPGTEVDSAAKSREGEVLFFERDAAGWPGGDVEGGTMGGGTCIDCEEERLKNGIEDGVNLLDCVRWADDEVAGIADVVLLVLSLDPVPDRLRPRSGVFAL